MYDKTATSVLLVMDVAEHLAIPTVASAEVIGSAGMED